MKVFILFVSCALLAALVHGAPPKNQGKAVGKQVKLPAGVKSVAPNAAKSPQPVVSGLDKLLTKLMGNLEEQLNNSVDDLMSALYKIMSKLEISIDDESNDDDLDSASAAPVAAAALAAVKGSKN